MVELWEIAARPHDIRHLRLRRQWSDRDLALCPAADLARTAAGSAEPVVRADRLQPVLRARGDRLFDGNYPVEGIRGARMVCRYLAGGCVGRVFADLPAHAGAAQGTSHLRF